jgi:hypothetical protein
MKREKRIPGVILETRVSLKSILIVELFVGIMDFKSL